MRFSIYLLAGAAALACAEPMATPAPALIPAVLVQRQETTTSIAVTPGVPGIPGTPGTPGTPGYHDTKTITLGAPSSTMATTTSTVSSAVTSATAKKTSAGMRRSAISVGGVVAGLAIGVFILL